MFILFNKAFYFGISSQSTPLIVNRHNVINKDDFTYVQYKRVYIGIVRLDKNCDKRALSFLG